MINEKNAYKDDLLNTTWLGEVVDIEDPLMIGRIKVNVFGKFDSLLPEDIPWAYPGINNVSGSDSGGGFHSVPKLKSVVSIKFDCGNIYHPEYFFHQSISNEVKEEIKDSYPNSHVLLYDTITEEFVKVFFTEKKGLMLDYKSSQINILPDKSIVVQSASGDSKIEITDDGKINITQKSDITITCDGELKIKTAKDTSIDCKNANIKASGKTIVDSPKIELGKGATQSVIKGNLFMSYFNSHMHPTPAGPAGPPIMPMTPSTLSQISSTK